MGVRILRIALPLAALVFVVWLNWPQGDDGRVAYRDATVEEAPADELPPIWDDLERPEPLRRVAVVDVAGIPVAGALVIADNERSVTDVNGIATFEGATGQIVVRHPGYRLRRAWANNAETLVLQQASVVRGRAVGASVVRIWDQDEDEEIDLPQAPDAEGRFELTGIRDGYPFIVMAIAEGYMSVQTVRHDLAKFELKLGEGATLSGRVIDHADRPVAGAEVYVSEDGVEPPWDRPRVQLDYELREVFAMGRCRTDPDGAYAVNGLTPGAYRVFAVTGKARAMSERLEIDGDARQDVRLAFLGTLTLRVTGPDGKEPEGWRAVADGPQYVQFGDREATVLLEKGSYELEVWCGDLQRYHEKIEIVAGETRQVDATLRRGLQVTGIVVDSADNAIADAQVSLDHRHYGQTDEQGRFRIDGAPEGKVTLRAGGDRYYETARELTLPATEPVRVVLAERGRLVVKLEPRPEHVSIEMSYANGGSSTGREPDPDGRVTVWDPGEDGPCQISLEFKEYAPITLAEFRFKRGQVIDLGTRKLDQGVTLRGVVVDVAGVPIAGVAVEVREPVYRTGVRTDKQGRYEYARLPREPLYVRVIAAGYPTTHWKVDPTRPAVNVTLRKGGEIRGRVIGPDGKPVPKCSFVFWPVNDKSGWWEVEADAMGHFSVLVPAGRLRCRVYGERRQELEQVITVEAGQVTQIELRLR